MPTIVRGDSYIHFEFPELENALQKLGERHAEAVLPRILQEKLVASLALLIRREFTWVPAESVRQWESRLGGMTAQRVAEHLRDTVRNQITNLPVRLALAFARSVRHARVDWMTPPPAHLGYFPLRRTDEFYDRVSGGWPGGAGVLIPMYRAEAMRLVFSSRYSFAVKVAVGGTNAINGQPWSPGLPRVPQGYVVVPEQPNLDGWHTESGGMEQFLPGWTGESAGRKEAGLEPEAAGLRIEVVPCAAEAYFEKLLAPQLVHSFEDLLRELISGGSVFSSVIPGRPAKGVVAALKSRPCQGLCADSWAAEAWDLPRAASTRVHLCDSDQWHRITGERLPGLPFTAAYHGSLGLPRMDYREDDFKTAG
jgi:hypothetical protein